MRRCLGLVLALAAAASPVAAQTPGLVHVTGAERLGDRVHIRIATDGPMAAIPSEPFHLGGGRTRVFITIPGGTLEMPFDTVIPAAGMLALRADAYNGAVRVTADVASLGDFGVAPTESGMDLWLQLERPAAAAPAASPPATQDLRTRATALAVDLARNAQSIGEVMLRRVRSVDARSSPVRAALLITLLLVTVGAWRVVARGRTVDRAATGGSNVAVAATARIRTARQLASEGMDADAVAREAGISRDVATLLVTRRSPAEPAAPGTLFRAKLRREPRVGK